MKQTCLSCLLFVVLIFSAQASKAETTPPIAEAQKAILVTGASTGIGRMIAEKLASDGHFVYAGARKPEDIKALSAIPNIEGIRLDVTKQDEIDAAVALVKKRGKGLYGLVNNAGVVVLAPLIEATEDDMQFIMDVNLFGPYRVTKAFAPMLIESKGRITTIGSISGTLASPMMGPYSMSKHAVEAYTDALAREMQKFGVEVSVIEPGNFKSDIALSFQQRMQKRGQEIGNSLYKEELEARMSTPMDRSEYKEPEAVAIAVEHALFDASPRRRYMVVPNQQEAEWTIHKAMEKMVQLNQDQTYSYDRKQLIQMLDAALKDAEPAKPKPSP